MPILVVFYSLGYATGNVAGILVERWFAFGMIILKVFSLQNGRQIADFFWESGQPVTIFSGEGRTGPVLELYLGLSKTRSQMDDSKSL